MELIPAPPQELTRLSVEELENLLERTLATTAEQLLLMAHVVSILDSRGKEAEATLARIQPGLLTWLRRIANRQLLPVLFLRLCGFPHVLREVGKLPFSEQKRLADGGKVEVLIRGEGGLSPISADPANLSPDEVKQVFSHGTIRTEAAQRLWIAERTIKQDPDAEPVATLTLTLTPAELERLTRNARKDRKSVSNAVKDALQQAGLI